MMLDQNIKLPAFSFLAFWAVVLAALFCLSGCAWFNSTMERDADGKREQIFGIGKNDTVVIIVKDKDGYWKEVK